MQRTLLAVVSILLYALAASATSVNLTKQQILGLLFEGRGMVASNDSSNHRRTKSDGYRKRASDVHVHWYADSATVQQLNFCCNFNDPESLFTRVIYTGADQFDTAMKAFVVTETVPVGYECAPCAPAIGIGLLVHDAAAWHVAAYQPRVLNLGSDGIAPATIQQMHVGPGTTALSFEWGVLGQGLWKSGATIVALVDNGFKDILRMTLASNDSTVCAKGTTPCWGYTSTYRVLPDIDSGYYRIQQRLSGSRLAEKLTVKIEETVTYRFTNDGYHPEK